jgi:signal transduction histidine kinase
MERAAERSTVRVVIAALRTPRLPRAPIRRLLDVGLALVFVAVGELDAWTGWGDGGSAGTIHGHRALNALLLALFAAPLAVRRRWPFAGLCLMLAVGVAQVELVQPVALFFAGFVPVVLMTYAVAAYPERRYFDLAGAGVALGGLLAISQSVPAMRNPSEWAFDSGVLATTWIVGKVVGTRGRRIVELGSHAEQLERETEENARAAVAEERTRLARELHDIVAHSVSVIAVQAEAGETLVSRDPRRAEESFRAIQQTSRQALIELRRLLGLLRADAAGPALDPQPRLAELPALLDQLRGAGLPVELTVEGQVHQLPPSVDLSAYRILQEALTNVLKHAASASATVCVRYRSDEIEVEVADDASGAAGSGNGGHGLIGMRERVALYGGRFEAGPVHGGGFCVRAVLPLTDARP